MLKLITISIMLCLSQAALATEAVPDSVNTVATEATQANVADAAKNSLAEKGFSFFMGVGMTSLRYQETSKNMPVKSDVQANNIILNTGALYSLTPEYLFSIDNFSTFYPVNASESWHASSPFTAGGSTFQTGILQQNNFTLSQSDTRLALHKRIANDWFVIAGPSLNSGSFKRNGVVAKQAGINSTAVVEESFSEVNANIGLGLESEQVLKQDTHYSANLMIGTPVWRRLQNTNSPDKTFTTAKGYDIALTGRYSWAVREFAHIGLWGRLSSSYRDGQSLGNAELPRSRLESASSGLELLWKL